MNYSSELEDPHVNFNWGRFEEVLSKASDEHEIDIEQCCRNIVQLSNIIDEYRNILKIHCLWERYDICCILIQDLNDMVWCLSHAIECELGHGKLHDYTDWFNFTNWFNSIWSKEFTPDITKIGQEFRKLRSVACDFCD